MKNANRILQITGLMFLWFLCFQCAKKSIPNTNDQQEIAVTEASPNDPVTEEKEVSVTSIYNSVEEDLITNRIKFYTDTIAHSDSFRIKERLIFSQSVLPDFYIENGYQLAWNDVINRRDVIMILSNSWKDGLIPDDYHLNEILETASELLDEEEVDYELIAQLDILLTDGLLLYAYHLIKGKLHPETVELNWNFNKKGLPGDPTGMLMNALVNHQLDEMVVGLRSKLPIYTALIDGLDYYTKISLQGGWDDLDFDVVIKPGAQHDLIPQLRERLILEGYPAGNEDGGFYNGNIVEAVKSFQINHGLNNDGVIGKNTVAALNISVEKKIEMIRINQERARWVIDEDDLEVLVVNIAKYRLYLYDKDKRIHDTNVMVGKFFTQTPVFTAPMKYIEFNPTWTVPYSIASKETLPRLKTDANYLKDRNMVLLDRSGKILDESGIDFSKYSANNFPYTLRQEPGPGNALGIVKFIFPNKHAVYLHDTPSKYLFSKESRAFSHGCIRVQNPIDLAEVILKKDDPGKWDRAAIDKIVASKKLTRAYLRKPIDVLLLYWTCGLSENGNLFFIEDIYQRDEKVLKGLDDMDWDDMVIGYRKELKAAFNESE